MQHSPSPLLDTIAQPADVARLGMGQSLALAEEVRQRIIETVSCNGGHLAPSLGVVELTIALLQTFAMDVDKLVWDVGHQSYAWKLLTGRAPQFDTLRTLGGISGFPRRDESRYDHFGVGHSSTSISAALGMAMARDLAGQHHNVVAVIGDGSLTGGEALEGLNLAGHAGRRLIVVLNDNEMSISPNVGALSRFLSRTLSRRWVRQTKKDVLKLLRSIPHIGDDLATYAQRGEYSFKSFFTPGMLFEAFRFNYLGPVDGHDLGALKRHLEMAKHVEDGPVLLHVLTRKGKGYVPAEENPSHFHGLGPFDIKTGKPLVKKASAPSFTEVFGKTVVTLASQDERIIAITAAMPEGTGTEAFQKAYPERFVDVGICEQHAVTFAAGLASRGCRPVVAIYSTFLQRAYDQIVHDVCLQNLPVTFCVDRAGLVGEDGATHHGVFDIAYMRSIPNMHILAPADENMLRHCLATAVNLGAPCAVRYPRGAACGVEQEPIGTLPLAQGCMLHAEGALALVAVGSRVNAALVAAQRVAEQTGQQVRVFDPVWLKPLPQDQLDALAQECDTLIFVEEGTLAGGFSSAVLEHWADAGLLRGQKIKRMGIGDAFIEHGTQAQLQAKCQLDADAITAVLLEYIEKQ